MAAARAVLGPTHQEIMRRLSDERLVPLGFCSANTELLPAGKLNRMLAAQGRCHPAQYVAYAASEGVMRLRSQIAKRSLASGCPLSPEQVVITSGCVEAVTLALQAVCQAGDAVAVESPIYYVFLKSMQWMGLNVVEIPSSPPEGINLDVLGYAIKHHGVKACIVISNFNNPLGSLMPDGKKRDLVGLLAKHDIPLIEDDVYGDLGFGRTRPPVLKTYDEKGLVLLCSSFSKTLAPGYRVGWIAPGRFQDEVERLKSLINIATASPMQLAVAEFLANGGYDRHLRTTRKVLGQNMERMRQGVLRHFPRGTRVSQPRGGYFLWVELPEGADAYRIHERALEEGISVAPGMLFTTGDGFRNCLRLNSSFWSGKIERALQTVGRLAGGQPPAPARQRAVATGGKA